MSAVEDLLRANGSTGVLDMLSRKRDREAKKAADTKPAEPPVTAPAAALEQLAGLGKALVQATRAVEELPALRTQNELLAGEITRLREDLRVSHAMRAAAAASPEAPTKIEIARDVEGGLLQLAFDTADGIRRLAVRRDRTGRILDLAEPPSTKPLLTIHRDANGRIASLEMVNA